MAYQGYATTGDRRLKPRESDILAGRMRGLSGMLRNQQRKEMIAREDAYRKKAFAEDKRQFKEEQKLKRKQSKQEFGLEIGKTAVNLATSDFMSGAMDYTIGDLGSDIKGLGQKIGFGGTKIPSTRSPGGTMSGPTITATSGGPGFFSNIPLGSIASGGAMGFGIGSVFGDKSKGKRALYGGLAGAGMGLLGGGLSGALGGGIGGLFGGLLS